MKWFACLPLVSLVPLAAPTIAAQGGDDPLLRPIAPEYSARWLEPREPSQVHANSYLVGFGGLNVGLIDTGDGLILIDGAVPQAVRAVEANIRRLGFRIEDVKYILSTEPHYDHAGGIAALARDSGATVVASGPAAEVLRRGRSGSDDPQAAHLPDFPGVGRLRIVADGETLRLGNVVVTAHATPGHTPGSMSWSWRSCRDEQCADIVFAASLNPISADGYRFTDPEHRVVVESFRRSQSVLRTLPCDLLITSHPGLIGETAPGQACRALADDGEAKLAARLAREGADPAP